MPALRPRIDYEAALNLQQREVVLAGEGPLLVIAGAGSGKTRTLTFRVARLLEIGLAPRHILLATFTNKAAREMLQRVTALVGTDAHRIWGGTFHHVAHLILRRHAEKLGYRSSFTILDRDDAQKLLARCIGDRAFARTSRRFPKARLLLSLYSYAVNTVAPVREVLRERFRSVQDYAEEIEAVLADYRSRKRDLNLMDFDDLLENLNFLLQDVEEVRHYYSDRFRHVLVDEYQDTNQLQAEIIDRLAAAHRNLMVVGDDSQSIYAFRGARFANILEFRERYPDAVLIKLETNYRSTPQILQLANSVIRHNRRQYKKVLRTDRAPGPIPIVVPSTHTRAEARYLAERIEHLHHEEGFPLRQLAVLYRAHAQSMQLQMELTQRQIPFLVRSGLRFFEQAHIKDVTSYLRVAFNPKDELAWRRLLLLYPGIGQTTVQRVWEAINAAEEPWGALETAAPALLRTKKARASWKRLESTLARLRSPRLKASPATMIRFVMEEDYLEYLRHTFENAGERKDDLEQLCGFAEQFQSTGPFLGQLSLLTNLGMEDRFPGVSAADLDCCILSTIHQAKGLEWPVVFVMGLVEGRFPDARCLRGAQLEEERRLFYVAATRAMDLLYLTYPLAESRRGATEQASPSRFLGEVAPELYRERTLEWEDEEEWS